MTAVTPTDRPKSVCNSCVIKVFGGVFMLSRCSLDCSVGVGVFVTGLSQISSFFSPYGSGNAIKTNTILQIFGLVAFIKQKENDNNDNLCKINGGLYIASALST